MFSRIIKGRLLSKGKNFVEAVVIPSRIIPRGKANFESTTKVKPNRQSSRALNKEFGAKNIDFLANPFKIKIDPNAPMKAAAVEEIIEKRLAEFEQRFQFEKEQAYKTGIDQGRSLGFVEGSRAFDAIKSLFESLENGLESWRSELVTKLEITLMKISVEMAEAIVGEVAIKSANEMLDYNLQKCLQQLAGFGKAKIRINPIDYDLIKENTDIFRQYVKGKTLCEFVSDSTIARGGCFIESDNGDIDGRIDSQINILKDSFLSLSSN